MRKTEIKKNRALIEQGIKQHIENRGYYCYPEDNVRIIRRIAKETGFRTHFIRTVLRHDIGWKWLSEWSC